MKRLSYPPFIVFFDTIAVFLFILILNQNKNPIDIEIPEQYVFPGGTLLFERDGEFYRQPSDTLPYQSHQHDYFLACGEQQECAAAKMNYPEANPYILLPHHLFEEMSKLTFLALRTSDCKSVKHIINDNGQLDYPKMLEANACLAKVNGFNEHLLKSVSQ